MIRQIVLLVFLLSSSLVYSQSPGLAAQKIDSIFSVYTRQTPGAAIAIVKDGKIVFTKGYGMADLEQGKPITPQTVFNIASVSKQFTAFAIYLLENEGKLSFEDDIRKFFPELPVYNKPIRIRHLLSHTSGLRDQWALLALAGWRQDDVFTTEQILRLLARQKELNYSPGTTFSYCNSGYTLLAEIVRRVSGKSFAAYTREKIFEPLRMFNTRFYDNHESLVMNRAHSYERVNDVYYLKPINVASAGPSNLMTTVEDLTKWVLNFEKPVVGNAALIRSFNEPSYFDDGRKVVMRVFGAGDTLMQAKGQNLSSYKGLPMITHGGHTAGFRTFMGRFPGQ
ncbi:MAG TPA: serine hydrolase domain-containing protein, partial [Ferruginibacter sp.]|nr:serine hydrolase domain-containing protein [Ferruginibacter sp.]